MIKSSTLLSVLLIFCFAAHSQYLAQWDLTKFDNSSIQDSTNGLKAEVISRSNSSEAISLSSDKLALEFNNSNDDSDANNSMLIVRDNDILTGHNNNEDGLFSLVIEIDIKPGIIKQSQLVRKTVGTTNVGYQLWMSKDGKIGFSVSTRDGKLDRVISKRTVEAGKWSKILAVWDGRYETYNMQLNVDGFVAWTGGINISMRRLSNTDSPLSIGGLYRTENNYGQFFSGQIKSVAISHDRPKLLNISGKCDPIEIIPTGADLVKTQEALLESNFIYQKPPTPECHASTVAALKNGEIAAAWFGGTHEGHTDVGVWFAKFDGRKWSEPKCIVKSPEHNQVAHISMFNPVLFQHSNGTLMLFYKEGWLEQMESRMISSDNNGENWSQIKYYPDLHGPSKNKPIELSDGSILCAAGGSGKELYTAQGELIKHVKVPNPNNYSGSIQGTFLRHKDAIQCLYRSMRERNILQSFSYDNGDSWSELSKTNLPNNNSGFDGVTLKDGRHLLVYNHVELPEGKWGGPRTPLNVSISEDGVNWKNVITLEDTKGEYSYPAIIQADDGFVHITYTWNRMRVKWAVIDPAKL